MIAFLLQEKQILELRRKCAEKEKISFIMQEKVDELSSKLQPKDDTIKELQSEILKVRPRQGTDNGVIVIVSFTFFSECINS